MAGQPRRRAMVAELTRRAAEMGEDVTPFEVVRDWVASGKTLVKLAKELSEAITGDAESNYVSRNLLSVWANAQGEGEHHLARARAEGAAGLVEEAVEIVDAPAESQVEVQQARNRADLRKWIAGKYNREAFGDDKQAQVHISIGQLHLDALRARAVEAGQVPLSLPSQVETVVDAEFETV